MDRNQRTAGNASDTPSSLPMIANRGSYRRGNAQDNQSSSPMFANRGSYRRWNARDTQSSSPMLANWRSDRQGNYYPRASNARPDRPWEKVSSNYDGSTRGRNRARTRTVKQFSNLELSELEDLSKKEPDDLVLLLSNDRMGFSALLDGKLRANYIVLIINIISKMCKSSFASNKATIMCMACKENFTEQLRSFILELALQEPDDSDECSYFWKNVEGFWYDVCSYCETIIGTIPSVALDVLPRIFKSVKLTLNKFDVSAEIKSNFVRLQSKLDMLKEESDRKQGKRDDEIKPPNDFRSLSLYPTSEEITAAERAFVRENIIKGAYKDPEHFLDVQFRLLREDFIAPLRESICGFLKGNFDQKAQSIKIHQKVQILRPVIVNGNRGVLLQLNFHQGQTFVFENSRRFMYGALMCFTKDNFKTLLFGTVVERTKELFENGQVVVGFESGAFYFEYGVDYTVIECNVYFEPYYRVLSALKSMNEDNFPMRRYLVDVNCEAELPGYFVDLFDLEIGKFKVDVRNFETWPSAEQLELDETQYQAYRTALTQKFAVIQGPPGTGKTYLGLRLVETLLKNLSFWRETQTPILVVCYTNHALDQFLEGLIGQTDRIVRIGGQSKNNELARYNIKELRSKHDSDDSLYLKRRKMEDKNKELQIVYKQLKTALSYDGILNFNYFSKLKNMNDIKNWLLVPGEQLVAESNRGYQHPSTLKSDQNYIERPNESNIEVMPKNTYVVSIHGINEDIENTKHQLRAVQNTIHYLRQDAEGYNLGTLFNEEESLLYEKGFLENSLGQLENNLSRLKLWLEQGKNVHITTPPKYVDFENPYMMTPSDRWILYFYWLNFYRKSLLEEIGKLDFEYVKLFKDYEEVRNINDVQMMKEMFIVGMTTTAAARLQSTLRSLQSPIVIVEEAAELLESHVVVSLTDQCKHLILIGDHQQLRPTTADYTMEKKYRLAVSLFERMVNNKLPCNVLGVQHRMRPEICELIVPAIYPKLENHKSVYNFPPVKGVTCSLYFINHTHPEESAGENSSKSNTHEARFLVLLAKYLILNGYEPEDITILAAYSGQMFTMQAEQKKFGKLENVRITILDNYQGEESKVILLSLVRNNNDNKIGFLSIENRVCVALSRAKEGLFIMGNIELLCSNSQVWPKIRTVLESQNSVGNSLPLRCQLHPHTVTNIITIQDFFKVAEGGCDKLCKEGLKCGHKCAMQCHTYNTDHSKYSCKEECLKSCIRDHPCTKMCWESCGVCNVLVPAVLACGHVQDVPCYKKPEEYMCQVVVQAELPCKHTVGKPCGRDAKTFPCLYPCDTRVDCGHACRLLCHITRDPDHVEYKCYKPCTHYNDSCSIKSENHLCKKQCHEDCSPCEITVRKWRTVCPHFHDVPCHFDVDELVCEKTLKKKLPCGHRRKLICSDTSGNCTVLIEKTVSSCGHKVTVNCSQEATKDACRKKCPQLLACGHPCDRKCKETCTAECTFLVDHEFTVDCGHKFQIPCHLRNKELESNSFSLLKYCHEPCTTILACEHKCSGSCGECYQGRVHKRCAADCGNILVCGHKCTIPCRQICQPCEEQCTYKCEHSKCKKKCGEPCAPCKEPCSRRCQHIRCTAKCGDKCTVRPCTEPCTKKLKCRHQCVGYCGDSCPPLCLICDRRELTEEFCLGYEDDEGARFVFLEECGHTIESKGLEMWLQSGEDQIRVKRCPRCNCPLAFTMRFSDDIKESIDNVGKVKRMFYGSDGENQQLRHALKERMLYIQEFLISSFYNRDVWSTMEELKEMILQRLYPLRKQRLQPFHNITAITLTSIIQIFEQIAKLLRQEGQIKFSDKCCQYIRFLLRILIQQGDRITSQEIKDLECEVKRLRRMLQFEKIDPVPRRYTTAFSIGGALCKGIGGTKVQSSSEECKKMKNKMLQQLYSAKKYNVEDDDNIKKDIIALSKLCSVTLAVRETELKEIVKATGVRVGAWYKCPNGHPYAIGDCGGAVVVSKCIECGAAVGGSKHQLLADNAHAGIVDNSAHAAWSEGANMLNYVLNDE